jgi:branched-chain amino acid transport system substrate-binding protein
LPADLHLKRKITIGLSLSNTGEYAAMGRQAEAALRMFITEYAAGDALRIGGEPCELALECHDDASDSSRCAEIYRTLCAAGGADIIFGPYSNRLARVAAPIAQQTGHLFVNHGGAGDELHERGYRLIVSVLSPASDYMTAVVKLLSQLKLWRKRLAIVSSRSSFASAITHGIEREIAERAIRRRGVRLRVKWTGNWAADDTPGTLFPALTRNRVDALLSAGSYQHDVAVMRAVAESPLNIMVLGCVAAGVRSFAVDLGQLSEGVIGPSQWEDTLETRPELGPTPLEFGRRMRAVTGETSDYPGAQAYAAGLLTVAALKAADSLDQQKLRAAFSDLRTTTTFGDFAIDRVTGRQLGHKMLLVQWHRGSKVIIAPESHADTGTLEFPSGMRLLLAAVEMLRFNRHEEVEEVSDDQQADGNKGRDERDHD